MPIQSKKVLIAEDEKPLASALKLKFQKVGVDAVTVFNGKDVFNELEKGKFDLILLDLIMPEMNGFAVLEEIKKKGIKTPVVVISNLGQEEDIKRSMELGAKDYIVKSNTPIIEIVNKVKKMLFK
ncbi:MAG: response regulator [Parcubacteria group bacterium]|nr:response regulator [Parcubacteria group bacterium]